MRCAARTARPPSAVHGDGAWNSGKRGPNTVITTAASSVRNNPFRSHGDKVSAGGHEPSIVSRARYSTVANGSASSVSSTDAFGFGRKTAST